MKALYFNLWFAFSLSLWGAAPASAAPVQGTEPAIHVGTPPPAPEMPHWQTFTSAEGRFSVLLPAAPDAKTSISPNKKITVKELICRVDGAIYVVAYFDTPLIYINAMKPETLLSIADKTFLGVEHVSAVSKRHLMLDKYPGHETVAERSGNIEVQRAYLVGNRLYTLAAVQSSKQPQLEPANTAKFFSSFALIPAKQAGMK